MRDAIGIRAKCRGAPDVRVGRRDVRFVAEVPFTNARADARTSGPDSVALGFRSQPTPHAAFAGMITRMDRDIGRLVELVEASGMGRRTLILFVSDNGPHHSAG